jgi:PHP family Zn ribbon phosphoesterase
MKQTVYVFQSDYGFLSDIEVYSKNPEEAVTFVQFDIASARFNAIKHKLKQNCKIVSVQIPFPRATAMQPYV